MSMYIYMYMELATAWSAALTHPLSASTPADPTATPVA